MCLITFSFLGHLHQTKKCCDYTNFFLTFQYMELLGTINLHSAMQCKEKEKDPLVMLFYMDVSPFVYRSVTPGYIFFEQY